MHITLLLNKVSHDQSTLTDDEKAFVGWAHGPSAGADKEVNLENRLPYLALRKEDWGGLVIHGPTLSVFHVDHTAFSLFERLKAGESLSDLETDCKGISVDDVKEFIKIVKNYKLDLKA